MFPTQCIQDVYKELSFFNEIYIPIETNEVDTHSAYQKLSVPRRKTNVGQRAWLMFVPHFGKIYKRH